MDFKKASVAETVCRIFFCLCIFEFGLFAFSFFGSGITFGRVVVVGRGEDGTWHLTATYLRAFVALSHFFFPGPLNIGRYNSQNARVLHPSV